MKITLITVGKTTVNEIKLLCDDYNRRINRYARYEEISIENPIKTTDAAKMKQKEGEAILKKLQPGDYLILLDEKGKEYTSVEFARALTQLFNQAHKNICFVIGGAYGFSNDLYSRANAKISLSKMTYNHQLIRAIFSEQLYRAFTIINNEPYHHV